MLEISALIMAVLIGAIIGLMGGGGSILTVPVLVYLLGYTPIVATGYSLFVVGSASLFGAVIYARQGRIDFRAALALGIPAAIAVFLTRQFIVPAIPESLFTIGNLRITNNLFLMLLFAAMMLLASFSLIRKRKDLSNAKPTDAARRNFITIGIQGFGIGIFTGLVGVGGGFMIVPALVILARLEMKTAVGTSLLIMGINSLFGFLGDILHRDIHWEFLLLFTGLAVVGIFIGNLLSRKISGQKLKTGFGWLILIMGIYIIFKELAL